MKKYWYIFVNTFSESVPFMVFINVPSAPGIFELLFVVFEILRFLIPGL